MIDVDIRVVSATNRDLELGSFDVSSARISTIV